MSTLADFRYKRKYLASNGENGRKNRCNGKKDVYKRQGQDISKGLLIAGPPSCGKTTLLRDLARQLATGAGGIPKKVAIIDERGELAGTYCGIPQNDLGLCSDILDHYPKGEGMIQAVRCLLYTSRCV